MKKLRLGTRGSKLALWQAEHVANHIRRITNIDVEIIIIKTKGDKILDVALSKIGDKGLFTKEIENELLSGNIDIAVHSMKDLPSQITSGLVIGAVLARENPWDVLISKEGVAFDQLPPGSIIGTSSLRRIAQIKSVRPDISTVEIRGNIETRIRRMREANLDGIILAYAGVKRLGLEDYISDIISSNKILPAVGQGAIAVEARENDLEVLHILSEINDEKTKVAVGAERAFLKELEGGCQVPIAAYANIVDNQLNLTGLVASLDGQVVYKSSVVGDYNQAIELGVSLAKQLVDRGALEILKDIKKLGD